MTRNNARARSEKVFKNLEEMVANPVQDGEEDTQDLVNLHGQAIQLVPDLSRLPRMKKFRFQLLHQWLIHNFPPCKAADIGGGKGLLAYLLQTNGWQATVIDPVRQGLPEKYKDICAGIRVKIPPGETLTHIDEEFEPHYAAGFDLLIGMHAHACNAKIIDAAAQYGCSMVIFPCCVIGEPFYPPLGVHWLESLADYAIRQGLVIHPFRLNFKGQNIGLYASGRSRLQLPDQ